MAWNEMNLKYARNQEANEMQRNEKNVPITVPLIRLIPYGKMVQPICWFNKSLIIINKVTNF